MCSTPASRARKAQRKLKRYNRRHGVHDTSHAVGATTLQLPGAFEIDGNGNVDEYSGNGNDNVNTKDVVLRSDGSSMSPPSYSDVVGKAQSGRRCLDADVVTVVRGQAEAGTRVACHRCAGADRAGSGCGCGAEYAGCCAKKGGVYGCGGGTKRVGLVGMVFRLVRGKCEAYKEGNGRGIGAGAGVGCGRLVEVEKD